MKWSEVAAHLTTDVSASVESVGFGSNSAPNRNCSLKWFTVLHWKIPYLGIVTNCLRWTDSVWKDLRGGRQSRGLDPGHGCHGSAHGSGLHVNQECVWKNDFPLRLIDESCKLSQSNNIRFTYRTKGDFVADDCTCQVVEFQPTTSRLDVQLFLLICLSRLK